MKELLEATMKLQEFQIPADKKRLDVQLILAIPREANKYEVFNKWVNALILSKPVDGVSVEAGEMVRSSE